MIINTPNNPTGVVYSDATLRRMAEILKKKEQEFGSMIVLISDEPYRELAYDGVEVPYVTNITGTRWCVIPTANLFLFQENGSGIW